MAWKALLKTEWNESLLNSYWWLFIISNNLTFFFFRAGASGNGALQRGHALSPQAAAACCCVSACLCRDSVDQRLRFVVFFVVFLCLVYVHAHVLWSINRLFFPGTKVSQRLIRSPVVALRRHFGRWILAYRPTFLNLGASDSHSHTFQNAGCLLPLTTLYSPPRMGQQQSKCLR